MFWCRRFDCSVAAYPSTLGSSFLRLRVYRDLGRRLEKPRLDLISINIFQIDSNRVFTRLFVIHVAHSK
jgi:hypothetical protein